QFVHEISPRRDQRRRCLCDLRQSPVAVDIYLLQPPAAVLLLRAVRLFFRPRVDVRWDVARPRLLERSKLLGRPRLLERSKLLGRPRLLAIGPRTSENISHPTPAAMRREAIGLWRACFARIRRTSSPKPRGFTPPNRSLTTVVGET